MKEKFHRLINTFIPNLRFYVIHIVLNVGKIDSHTFQQLIELAKPSIQPYLKSLWRKMLVFRYIKNGIDLCKLLVTFIMFYAVFTDNLVYYLVGMIMLTVFIGISSAMGNYMQDYLLLHIPLFITTIMEFITERNANPILREKVRDLTLHFRHKIHLERQSNVWITIVIGMIGYTLLLSAFYGLSLILIVLSYIVLILVNFVITTIMTKLYHRWYIKERELESAFQNNTEQHLTQLLSPDSFTDLGSSMSQMTVIKVLANIYREVYIIILLVIILISSSVGGVSAVLLLFLMTNPIEGPFYWILRDLPQSLSVQKESIDPLLHELKTSIPSPISQPSNNKKIGIIKSIELKDIVYSPPDMPTTPMFVAPSFSLETKPGIYSVIGDSGEGKSLFLGLLGNNLKPTQGKVSVNTRSGESIDYNDLSYWELFDKIHYVWITKKSFTNTIAIQLFRSRLSSASHSFSMLVSESIPADLLSDIRTNTKYLFQTTYQASTIIEQKADLYIKNLLNRTLFESGLFRESEDHIMTTNIEALSGGQQARLLTAYYLTGPEQVVILDEGLERTTQRFSTSGVYTRERLIRFIGNIAESSGKTILLIVQGGSNEQQLVHKFAGDYYLGCLKISNKSVSYCTNNQ